MRTLLAIALLLVSSWSVSADWDFSKHDISLDEIRAGGPPRDGIPALTNPEYLPAALADFMRQDEPVLGVELNGAARAYPLRVLSWHEVVNDQFGGEAVLVSWCPLAYAGLVHSRRVDGKELTFGVSGLLYQSNLLMYDRQTESLWSQVKNRAVTGLMTGTRLKVLPSSLTTWRKWHNKHPDTMVLSLNTGYDRDYSQDPYEDYYRSKRSLFGFFRGRSNGHDSKEMIAGVTIGDRVKAYPLNTLRQRRRTTDTFGGRILVFTFLPKSGELILADDAGENIPYVTAYGFVWQRLYPDSERFTGGP